MSKSSALFKILFFIFDVPKLLRSGACLILSSIIFFPISELIAFEPMSRPFFNRPVEVNAFVPKFTIFPKRLPPFCVLGFLCHLCPICRALFMVTFLGRFFLLTLSYLATKDCPFGNVTRRGVTRRLNAYCRRCRRLLPPSIFLITGPTIAPNGGPANEPNIGAIGRNPPFCLRLFRLPPIYQTPCLTDYFPFILKSRRLLAICYKFYDVM